MLEKVKLHNFKSHRSTELNLDDSRLHALVGQNSSGKTKEGRAEALNTS